MGLGDQHGGMTFRVTLGDTGLGHRVGLGASGDTGLGHGSL